ncbi:MAG: heparinase II/III family protein [Clostridia bacterium]|nr:heparinase II/III family protein [Clostridia bacterium]
MKKEYYLNYVKQSSLIGSETYDEAIVKWKEQFDADFMFGYTSPGNISNQIHLESIEYRISKDRKKAESIRYYLLQPMELCSIFPEEVRKQRIEYKRGVPLMEPLFQLHAYINGYTEILESGVLSNEDISVIKETIIRSIIPLVSCPEWGAHNRSMLRASALAQAYEAVGECEDTKGWIELADYLAEESMGRWSIEDASHYIPLWLFACVMYAKYRNIEDEYYSKPQTKYYFDYITHLICPDGRIPGFGDAWFHSNWQIWMALLEMGATKYKCGKMKKAAELIGLYGDIKANHTISPGIGNYMAYAYKWADDSVEPEALDFGSEEVLDELVGKKIAFRNEGTYFLYNYRDEGYYGYIPRRYLRTSIPVKAEKMHHGHGDENSIVTLVKDGDILLHEGGYRDRLPNGKYRADMYHNKLSFREGLKDKSSSTYDKLHDDGYYKHVDTEKLHFQSFSEIDYLRTRNYYRPFNLVWDRSVTYLKKDEVFIIVDYVKHNQDNELTIVNNIHVEKADLISEGVYETFVDTIKRGQNDTSPYQNKKEYSLLVEFIRNKENCTLETIRRNHGEAAMLSEVVSKSYQKGETEIFVTILTIKKRSEESENIAGRLTVEKVVGDNEAVSLVYKGSDTIYLTSKLDLDHGINEYEEDRAPAYDWESGKINYGTMTTDADFSYLIDGEKKKYGFINGCRVYYNDKEIFATPRYTSRDFLLEFFKEIDHKWRAWSGEVTI